MSLRTTISAVAAAVAALLLVALAPTGAAAHGGIPHAHIAKPVSDGATVKKAAGLVQAELRAQARVSPDHRVGTDCGNHGCCGAGHCSGCGTAIAPVSWSGPGLPSDDPLLNPDATQPAGLPRDGPPRPPKPFA